MASTQTYGRLPVFYNGSYLEQVTGVSFVTESGVQRVELLTGLGGFTEGPGSCTIRVEFALPVSGQEKSFQQDCANLVDVEMQLGAGADSYAGVGKIERVELNHQVGSAVSGSFDWTGPKSPMES